MPTKWPDGVGRIILPVTDSTLSEAARRFADLTQPTWILAHEQTAARGRRGRAWVNPTGNFAGTLAMQLDRPPDQAALRSFVVALALYDVFEDIIGSSDMLALKWPNDVLLNGGKVAGILLESLMAQGQIAGLAIGIGVNLFAAPDSADVETRAVRPVSLRAETGVEIGAEDFLAKLASAFAARDADFTTYGFAPVREAWLARAARLGEVMTARLANEEITGTFDTLDENGYLVLNTAKGPRSIAAADVFF